MNTVYSSKKIGKRLSKIIFLLSLIIFIGFVTPNGEVVAAEVPRLSRIGFTSDIHKNTIDLNTWLNGLKISSTQYLNHFIFGGDFEYEEHLCHETAAKSVALVKNSFPDTEIYTARGNHDIPNIANFGNKGILPITNSIASNIGYNEGLVYDGYDYAVYIMKMESFYEQVFSISDIFKLSAELNRIDSSKPVLIVSHFPIHQWSMRTTENALNLINVLNNHKNVFFFWGHNHSLLDPTYSKVLKADDYIKYGDYSHRQIGFTYASMGSMFNDNDTRGNRGILTTIEQNSEESLVRLEHKNLSGLTILDNSVTVKSELAETYKVEFESNGGSAISPIENISKYENIELPEEPIREGFIFEDWYTDNKIFENKFIKTKQITSDIILYAKWTEIVEGTYKLSFDSNGGSRVLDIINIEKDTNVILPKPPFKNGFAFDGWFTQRELINEFTEDTRVNKDMTLYAKWIEKEETYTITFENKGGTDVDPITDIIKGSTVKLPETFKEGYTFVGWFTERELINEFTEETPVNSDIKLYPKGVRIPGTYIIKFNSNGGSTVYSIVNYGSRVTLPIDPSKDGYAFEGWFTDYGTFKREFTEQTLLTSDIVLHAKWTEILTGTYKLSFDSNGGSRVLDMINIKKDTSVILPKPPFKNGFAFDGWFIDSEFKNEFTEDTRVNKDMTLYAKWIEKEETYTIIFNTRGGSIVDTITDIVKGSTVKLPETFKEGYVFDGWFTDIGLKNEFTEETPVMSDITLYPKGVRAGENSYTVMFNSNGGSTVSPIANVVKDTTVRLPKVPTKEGFVFAGWFTDVGMTSEFTEDTKVTANITLYAKWTEEIKEETYTITFNTRGGNIVDPITDIAKGSTVELPETFKEGYTFVGWFTERELINEFTEDTPVTKDITLYPKGVRIVQTSYSRVQSLQKVIDQKNEGESWITEIEIIDNIEMEKGLIEETSDLEY